jgi:hypothetical protein
MSIENKKSILIDKDLHYDLKLFCTKKGLTLHKVVEALIESELDNQF